jgi:hypothetical protein
VVASLASFGLLGATAVAGTVGDAFSPDVWGKVANSSTGRMLLVRAALAAAAGGLLFTVRSQATAWWRSASVVVAVGIVFTFPAAGHPASLSPKALWILLDAMHLSSVVVWVGGLALFTLGGRAWLRDDEAAPVVHQQDILVKLIRRPAQRPVQNSPHRRGLGENQRMRHLRRKRRRPAVEGESKTRAQHKPDPRPRAYPRHPPVPFQRDKIARRLPKHPMHLFQRQIVRATLPMMHQRFQLGLLGLEPGCSPHAVAPGRRHRRNLGFYYRIHLPIIGLPCADHDAPALQTG